MCVCLSLTYSEVGCSQGICGVAVLTNDGGGVSLLTVVVTLASSAGQFADGGCEDHLDPPCVVAHSFWQHGTHHEEEGEKFR